MNVAFGVVVRFTMVRPPYDAVLCDIDGVLRHWPSARDIERANGLPVGALAAAAFAPARLQPAITGQLTDEQWRSMIVTDLAVTLGSVDRARTAVAAWSDLSPVVNDDVVTELTQARDATPLALALVSNATTRLEGDLERQGLSDLADVVVNSARIGVAKPDPRVYLIAAQRVDAPVHRCLFIDDTAVNAAAARDVGMTAVHYRGIEDLRHALAQATCSRTTREHRC